MYWSVLYLFACLETLGAAYLCMGVLIVCGLMDLSGYNGGRLRLVKISCELPGDEE